MMEKSGYCDPSTIEREIVLELTQALGIERTQSWLIDLLQRAEDGKWTMLSAIC